MKLCEESEPTKIPKFTKAKAQLWPWTCVLVILSLIPTFICIEKGKVERSITQLEDPSYTLSDRQRVEYLKVLRAASPEQSTALYHEEVLLLPKTGVYKSAALIEEALAIMTPGLLAHPKKASAEFFETLLRLQIEYGDKNCVTLINAFHPQSPGALREGLAKIKKRELRVKALLFVFSLGFGESKDLNDLMQSVELNSPAPDRNQRLKELLNLAPGKQHKPSELEVAALEAVKTLGKAAQARLVKGLRSASPGALWLCVRGLEALDPEILIAELEKKRAAFRSKGAYQSSAIQILRIFKAVKNAPRNDKRLLTAEKLLSEIHQLSQVFSEGLTVIKELDREDARSFMLKGLAIHDKGLAKVCEVELKKQWEPSELTRRLFSFLAQKKEFLMQEIVNYESALLRYGESLSEPLNQELARLYDKAGKNPAKIYWVQKTIALRCLAKIGKPSAYPIIQSLSRDPNGYSYMVKVKDAVGKEIDTKAQIRFRDLCKQALDAISKRSKQAAPALLPEDKALLLPKQGGAQ
ncbi:MAG: hypothetical protein P1V97_21805 [Planctomycetota bacterium]|nr:hypothetical protein [Planctomycetota bacterium]